MTTRVIETPPAAFPQMLKAALPVIPGVGNLPGLRKTSKDLPDLTLVRKAVVVDPAHVAAYAAVCGFPRKDALPVPYLHMLAFPLHMTMLTDPSFPYPAMGMVHLENTISTHRATTAAESYDVSVRATNLRPHPKGTIFDMVSEVRVGDELVWDEISTYLRRGKGDETAAGGMELAAVEAGGVEWRVPGDQGRRYAEVSGDYNPIHLYPLTARALGFPRQIAHGMWSKARCIAAVENRLPEKVTVRTAFKTPVLLPASVRFHARTSPDGTSFSLVNPRNGAPHLHGHAS